jgi:restriction system protein
VAIPDFQTVMLPLLESIADGKNHSVKEVTDRIADVFGLTEEERVRLLPSGQQGIISNRAAWAKTHMKMAGLLENPARGYIRLSALGRQILAAKPPRIEMKFLRQFPAYLAFIKKSQPTEPSEGGPIVESPKTPKELIDDAYKTLHSAVAEELLEKVRQSTPLFFEEIVVRLLVAMGYGGSLADAGQRIGRSGDGGIDGIIKEDRLGLDLVCIQAKRWEGTVGRPVVQSFVGSMEMYRARKGVLLTTSAFTAEAREFVKVVESKKIVLIDGEMLADLMIDYGVGVSVAESYVVKKVDFDFFNEGE